MLQTIEGCLLIAGGFRISGKVATQCLLSETVTGDLTVDSSGVPILSIDIQLLRIESIAAGDRMATEKTDIQTTQVRGQGSSQWVASLTVEVLR